MTLNLIDWKILQLLDYKWTIQKRKYQLSWKWSKYEMDLMTYEIILGYPVNGWFQHSMVWTTVGLIHTGIVTWAIYACLYALTYNSSTNYFGRKFQIGSSCSLSWALQNPPSIPTLVAVKFASWLRRSSFIIDWHNFGYTLLGLSLGRSNILVKTYYWYI